MRRPVIHFSVVVCTSDCPFSREKSRLLIASSCRIDAAASMSVCARQLVRFIGGQVHRLVQGVSPPAQIILDAVEGDVHRR